MTTTLLCYPKAGRDTPIQLGTPFDYNANLWHRVMNYTQAVVEGKVSLAVEHETACAAYRLTQRFLRAILHIDGDGPRGAQEGSRILRELVISFDLTYQHLGDVEKALQRVGA